MYRLVLVTLLALSAAPARAAESFPTPEAAVDALAAAVADRDQPRLRDLFGPGYWEFSRGQQADPALAHARLERFENALALFHNLAPQGPDRFVLFVGPQGWPFPIPLVRGGDGWQFDGDAGVEELRNRLVGANELNAIAVLDAYATAQREYVLDDHDGDGVREYAQRLRSSQGARDGLYWSDDEGAESPLGWLEGLADALLPDREPGDPLLGYYFGVLKAQGPHASAGAYDYRVNGHMVGGFAAIAWPAEYGHTGVMTLIVNQDGIVYERDLGADTAALARDITAFDPDESWSPVDDDATFAGVPPGPP